MSGRLIDQAQTTAASLRRAVVLGLFACLVLVSCSGGGGSGNQTSPPPPPPSAVAVAFSSTPPTNVAVGAQVTFTAVVSNAANTAVTWSVTCGSAGNCGSFPINEGALNYVAYAAPDSIPSGKTVTVTATSVADSTKSASATMTVTAPISSLGKIPASLQVNNMISLQAEVGAISTSNPSVTWTLACGSPDCGSVNPATTSNLTTTTYTAPATVPSGGAVTITATSMLDPTQAASESVSIIPQVPNLPDGTYVFQVPQPLITDSGYATGAFVAKGGSIVGGEADVISDTVQSLGATPSITYQLLQITGGNYSIATDGSIQVTIVFATGAGDLSSQFSLTGELEPGSERLVAQLHGVGGAGMLQLQSSIAAPQNGYVFSLNGYDKNDENTWMGGVLNIDGSDTISGAGSVLDIQDYDFGNGLEWMAQPIGASTVSAPDQYGRVVFQVHPSEADAPQSLYLSGYIVDGAELPLIEIGGDNYGGNLFGTAMSQGVNTGKFSSASITGSSYAFGLAGLKQGIPYQVAGNFALNSGGVFNGQLCWTVLPSGAVQILRSFTGQWTVDSTGRVTLSNMTDGTASLAPSFNYNLEFYVTGNGSGLLLSNDPPTVWIAGQAFQMQGGTLDATSFSGAYGFSAEQTYTNPPGGLGEIWNNSLTGPVASAVSSGDDSLTGVIYASQLGFDSAYSGSFTKVSNGILSGSFTGLDPISATASNPYFVFLIDDTRAIAIESDTQVLTLGLLSQ